MAHTAARVTDVWQSGPFVGMTLRAPEIASRWRPGRFVLADLGGYLRTPLFPTWPGDREIGVLVSCDHPAASLAPGSSVDLVGPLGHGFQIQDRVRRLLLVADVPHLPVLLPLVEWTGAQEVAPARERQERSVALLPFADTAAELYPVHLLPPAVEVHVVTADGSTGRRATENVFPDLARWADCICLADDPDHYPALADTVRQVRLAPGEGFAQALVVPSIVCGVGACQGCAVATAGGYRLACTHGPVFDLLRLR